MTLSALRVAIDEHPVAAFLEIGSLVTCVGLFVGTLYALATGLPTGTGGIWLLIVVVGALFVLFWTALVPLYERVRPVSA